MVIHDIAFELKDGRAALIRSPKEEDIPGMLDYLYLSAKETDFLMRYPEECTRYTPEGEKALFDQVNASNREAMLLCLVEGKIAGYRSSARILESGHRDKALSGNDTYRRKGSLSHAAGAGIYRREHTRTRSL